MVGKREIRVVLEINHGEPTAAQLAALRKAWRLLSAMPWPAQAPEEMEAGNKKEER